MQSLMHANFKILSIITIKNDTVHELLISVGSKEPPYVTKSASLDEKWIGGSGASTEEGPDEEVQTLDKVGRYVHIVYTPIL